MTAAQLATAVLLCTAAAVDVAAQHFPIAASMDFSFPVGPAAPAQDRGRGTAQGGGEHRAAETGSGEGDGRQPGGEEGGR